MQLLNLIVLIVVLACAFADYPEPPQTFEASKYTKWDTEFTAGNSRRSIVDIQFDDVDGMKEIVDPLVHRYGGNTEKDTDNGRDEAFWAANDKSISNMKPSSLRRRCSNYLACEHHVPVVEVENAIFYDGALHLNNPNVATLKAIRNMNQIHA